MGVNNNRTLYWVISVGVTVIMLLLSRFRGSEVGILLVPIATWMIWKQDVRFYPTLVLLMAIYGYHLYAYLFMCLIMSIVNFKKLDVYPQVVKSLLMFLLIPVPVLVVVCIRNLSYFGGTLSLALEPILIYLGVFPFFFGLLISKNFNEQDSRLTLYSCLVIVAMQFISPLREDTEGRETIRLIFLAIPIVISFMAYGLVNRRYLVATVIGGGLLTLFAISGGGNTLTMMGSGLLSVALMIAVQLRMERVVRFVNSLLPYILSITFVAFVVMNYEEYAISTYDKSIKYDEISNTWNWESLKMRFQMKTFDDRAAIWCACWIDVSEAPYMVPNIGVKRVVIESASGNSFESDLYAHNQFLQILRTLRWGLGIFLIVGYIAVIILGGRFLRLPLKKDDPMTPIIASTIIVGVIGSTTGHYPLMVTFSFMFTSILGIGYGIYSREKRLGSTSYPTYMPR